ncbi:hypothetical protein HMPREF0045_00919 [Actinomyces graevenitzii C83]|uniref:Transmembrane protein n=2 Tax=Actinomyces graevenitzii TaxID=55565 RepID=G9PF95_9ACTO|nr:hypothetical protein HMPREF0045_00919 [Actinomyces graevenitzii C83]
MHSIAARFKHAGVFMALTVPFLTLSVASPAMAATPLATSPLTATSGTAPLSAVPLAADSASDDNIWLTIAIVAVGIALMSCIALALTVAKTRRNRTKLAQPLGAPGFPQMPSAPSAPVLGAPGFPQPIPSAQSAPVLGAPGFPQAMASASSAPALSYRPYIAPTPSLAPTAPAGLPLTAQPVNEVYPQRYGVPSQPDSGDLATLSHPNQNVQLAHELATPEGNQTRLVSTDGVAHAYPAEEPAWQMPPAGSSD